MSLTKKQIKNNTMKTNKITIGLAVVAIAFTSIISSCRKKTEDEKDKDTSSAKDQALASSAVNDLTNISDEAGRSLNISSFKVDGTSAVLSTCASLTFDTLLSAKTITVNFGTTNCLCNDGRYRRGMITLAFTGRYRDSLTTITVTPLNYYVNDNQLLGTKTIKNKGHNAAHHLVYEINANMSVVKGDGSGIITWSSIRQREWISGESTLTWNDDIYSITGGATGAAAGGGTFSTLITTPLIRNMALGCRRHFTSGVVEHAPTGKATRYIDYGSGACDDIATVTIDGVSYTITLP